MGGSPGDVGEVPHSLTLTSHHLRHSSLSNPSAALPTSQLILQPFRCFTYVTAHSPTLPPLLRHSSFYNPPLLHLRHRYFTYVASYSPTLLPLYLYRSSFYNLSVASHTSQHFTYFTWRAAHALWWCLIYPWWFCNLQWLRPAGLYERYKVALELKRLKTPELEHC